MVLMFVSPYPARAGAESRPLTQAPDGRPLSLAFFDNFRSFEPWTGNSGVWRTTFGDGPPFRRDPLSLERGGGFDAAATGTPPAVEPQTPNRSCLSGLITTQPSFSQTYGYFEMRAQLPEGKGLWPAFWMLPEDQSWPPEIDVVESIGDPSHVYMTAHSNVANTVAIEAHIAPNAFHIFAVSWDPRHLIWYIDGIEAGRVPTPGDLHKPMYLLANLAVGASWPGVPDTTSRLPARLMIDYIRAYRFET